MSVSIVIPALNEAGSIGETVTSIIDTLKKAGVEKFEVLVVDDGSTDGTGTIASERGAHVIRHPTNAGYGASLKDGIRSAQYDTIVISDADGSYPIESIPDLLSNYDGGFDMIVGCRTGEHYRESALKAPLRAILRAIVEYTANRKIPDINSGLRVFSRQTILPYFSHLCDTFSFTTSLTLAYMMTGRFVHYVDIDYNERIGKSKVRLWKDSIRTLQYIVEAATYYNPMKIFALLSMLCLVFMAVSVTLGFVFQITSAFLLAVGAALLSIVIFSIGLLAVLLKQIMDKS